MAVFCLLANAIPVNAQLIIRNSGHAELGTNPSGSQYVIATDVTIGNMVDSNSNRTEGDVTIKDGVDYEIEASGTVTLQDGFSVEQGASFAVYPSSF